MAESVSNDLLPTLTWYTEYPSDFTYLNTDSISVRFLNDENLTKERNTRLIFYINFFPNQISLIKIRNKKVACEMLP